MSGHGALRALTRSVVLWLSVCGGALAGCSLDVKDKTACVASDDCLAGWTCHGRTCVRADAGTPSQEQISRPPVDASVPHVDAGRSDRVQDTAPPRDGPSDRVDASVSDGGQDAIPPEDASTSQVDPRPLDGAAVDSLPSAPGERASSSSSHGPAAYTRSDATSAVVFGDSTDNVQELSLPPGMQWRRGQLSGGSVGAPTAAGPISVFVQGDGTNTVTYRAPNKHVWIFTLPKGSQSWGAQDLSVNATGCPPLASSTLAAGPPSGYTRSDRTSAIVFRGTDSHIYEVGRLYGDSCWQIGDLNGVGGPVAGMDPMGFVRADGYDSVVYADASGGPFEFYLPPGRIGSISWSNETLVNPPAGWTIPPPASGPPRGYVRSDGSTAVLYQSAGGHIWEISRTPDEAPDDSTWFAGELTSAQDAPLAVTDPMPYVRADGVNAVLYTDASGNLYEIALPIGSVDWSIERIYTPDATPRAVDGPMGYVRADHRSAVAFHDASGDIWQLLKDASGGWTAADLSTCAATPSSCADP